MTAVPYIIVAILGIILIVGVALAIFRPERAISKRVGVGGNNSKQIDIKDILGAENDMRSTIFQGIAALLLIVGGGLTLFQLYENSQAATQQLKLTQQQLKLTQQSQSSQQFTQAVSQLAARSDEPTHLGGVYGLLRVAREGNAYALDVVNVLAAFVRESAGQPKGVHTLSLEARKPSLQAALSVLSQLARRRGNRTLRLAANYDLRLADFYNFNLSQVDMEDDSIDGSDFSNADLSGACLVGVSANGTHFEGANLDGANLKRATHLTKATWDTHTTDDQYTQWPGHFRPPSARKINSPIRPTMASCG